MKRGEGLAGGEGGEDPGQMAGKEEKDDEDGEGEPDEEEARAFVVARVHGV